MRPLHGIGASLLVAALAACSHSSAAVDNTGFVAMSPLITAERERAFRESMDDLWSDHVVLTRNYIIEATSHDPAASSTLTSLMRNQEDIGMAMVPIYGGAAGSELTMLLQDHIRIAGEVVTAAMTYDNEWLDNANRRWHRNAEDIADFLAGANPHWDRGALVAMLNEHLALTTQEALAEIESNPKESQRVFEQVHAQAMHMADALADGILLHHPERIP